MMKLRAPLFAFCLLCVLSGQAQTVWLRGGGSLLNDEVLDLATAPDGDVLSCGYFNQTANLYGQSLQSAGSSDIFVSRMSVNGEALWSRRFGGVGPDRASAIAFGEDGSSYLAGTFAGTVSFGDVEVSASGDSVDVFVAKLDALGEPIWVRAGSSMGAENVNGISVSSEGQVVIVGRYRQEISFGSFMLEASPNGGGGVSSNGFVAALSGDGEWQWAKRLASDGENTANDVCHDAADAVYVCGRYNGDLTIDELHPNASENPGFLVKLNSLGEEQWFVNFVGAQLELNKLAAMNDGVVALAGTFTINLVIFSNQVTNITGSHQRNTLALKFNSSGAVLWSNTLGSDNALSIGGLAVGSDNALYLGGTFRCHFSGLTPEFGEGRFLSLGFRDIFVFRVTAQGQASWKRHFASVRDALCRGLSIGADGAVLLAGSHQREFMLMRGSDYLVYTPDNVVPMSLFNVNNNTTYCGTPNYGNWLIHDQTGNSSSTFDAFVSSCYNPSAPVFDQFERDAEVLDCSFGIPNPCITSGSYFESHCLPDTIEFCGNIALLYDLFLAVPGLFSEMVALNWSDNVLLPLQLTTGEGFYTVEATTLDGCRTYVDAFQLEFLEEVPLPLVSDDQGVNVSTPVPQEVVTCQEPVTFEVEACEGCEMSSNFNEFSGTTVFDTSGSMTVTVMNDDGCTQTVTLQAQIDQFLQLEVEEDDLTLIPLVLGENVEGQTIELCDSEVAFLSINPFPESYTDPAYSISTQWTILLDGAPYLVFDDEDQFLSFNLEESGHYEVFAEIGHAVDNMCNQDAEVIGNYETEFWVELTGVGGLDFQATLSSPNICPGSFVAVTLSGADSYSYNSSLPDSVVGDVLYFSNPVSFPVLATAEFSPTCILTQNEWISIPMAPVPEITMNPSSGLICPGEELTLSTDIEGTYNWVGPEGFSVGNTQSILASQEGFYFCEVTDVNGCTQVTGVEEILSYVAPQILALPGAVLCELEPVSLEVLTVYPEGVSWNAPLSGSSLSQVVDEPGTYSLTHEACGITEVLSIEVSLSNLFVGISSDNALLCPGESLELSAESNGTVLVWGPSEEQGETLLVESPGTYTLTAYDAAGCTQSASIEVEAAELVAPEVEVPLACANEDLVLEASGNGSIVWYADAEGVLVLAEGAQFNAGILTEATSFYIGSSLENCSTPLQEIDIELSEPSVTPLIGPQAALCAGAETELLVTNPQDIDYVWVLPSGEEASSSGPALPLGELSLSDAGWYSVFTQDEYCSSDPDSLWLEVFQPEAISIELANDSLCEGAAFMLSAPLQADAYQWSGPNGVVEGEVLSIPAVAGEDSGTYQLTLDGAGCDYEILPVNLYVGSYPEEVDPEASLDCRGVVSWLQVPDAEQVLWSDGFVGSERVVEAPVNLSVVLQNAPGCQVTANFFFAELPCDGGFYNVFSPNNDGVNDALDFGDHPAAFSEVLIYNRWGTLVAELKAPQLRWNGRSANGDFLNAGTYFWVGVRGSERVSGSVQILR